MFCPSCLPRSLVWPCLTIGRGDPPKVSDVVHLQHGANGAPCHESLVGDLHHRGGGPRRAALQGRWRDVGWSSMFQPRRRVASAWDAQFHPSRTWPISPAVGQRWSPPPTSAYPVMSGSPCPSASPMKGPPHPCRLSENGPRESQRARSGSLRSPKLPPPTEVAAGRGESTISVRLEKSGGRRRHRGPQGWCLGGTPISRAEPRRKDDSRNPRVEPKGATPVFPDFPVFLVPRLSLLPGFDGLAVFRQRGTKNTGYAWLRPCYGLVTQTYKCRYRYTIHKYTKKNTDISMVHWKNNESKGKIYRKLPKTKQTHEVYCVKFANVSKRTYK